MSDGSLLLHVTAVTHAGRVRDHNEDTLAAGLWVRNEPTTAVESFELPVRGATACLIADGMGGHAAGELASFYAAAHIARVAGDLYDAGGLTACLQGVNDGLLQLMRDNPDRRGMGTTVAGLLFVPDSVLCFNVGDSRVYQIRRGFLRQLSKDHVPEGRREDVFDPDRANRPGAKSGRLLQCLGGVDRSVRIEPAIKSVPVQMGTAFLLCSDGLTDMVGVDDLEGCLQGSDAEAVGRMLSAALDAGGRDNVSIMIVRLGRTGLNDQWGTS